MKNRIKPFWSFSILLSLLFLPSCLATHTEIQAGWHDKQYKAGPMKGVLVLLVTKDLLKRRTFEDTMNQYLVEKGVNSIAGYTVIPPDVEITEEFVKMCLVGVDADAILVSQIIGMKKEKEVIPGSYFDNTDFGSPFSRYYTRSYRSHYIPPTVVEVENLYLDNRLFRCDSEKMIWQLQLKVTNLKPFNNVAKELSTVVYRDLSRKQLL